MNKFITLVLLFFLCNPQSIISQEKNTTSVLNREMIDISKQFPSDIFFKKAVLFFLEKNWDSTLVYSQKQILTSQTKPLLDYSKFLRVYSFTQKKVFKEAEKEYSLISKNFKLYNLAKTYLGVLALEQRQFKKAITYFEDVIDLPEREYELIKKSSIIHNLGLCYLHLKKIPQAEFYLIKSIKIKEQQKDTLALIGTYGNVASLYYEQYKDALAIPYFEKAYLLAKKTNDFDLKRKATKNMAVVEENRKNYKKALVYRKEMEQWKDSLNDQNKIWEVAKLEKEFAVKEKQKEVNILQVENKLKETQRNLFLYSAAGLFILLGIGTYFYREKVKANKTIALQKENLDALNSTKDKLFSIVSHDLRSSVNALKRSNVTLLDNLASKNIDAIGTLLHKNSAIVNGAYNLLNYALLQTKQSYFNITSMSLFFITEQVAYNYKPLLLEKTIHFENTVSKSSLINADQESLKIILRNLLDNAIKFSKQNGTIKVYSQNNSPEYCDLVIEDTGFGMNEATRLKLLETNFTLSKKEHEEVIGTGLGIQLCKSMIKKNNGKFSIKSELGKGTKMIVSLPKTQDNG
ncbi:tetratricopeptide repeat protein [Tenacibaculum adriaticum]|uniref:histidine kinase n=1 Tax=Tenacibaculum adriaticum TaxID=413713 RepID=A0A5S5DXV3_9FLAO|nr:ATP-binding protein [Tenacibaculum adriaticum]TYP99439.1 tetratricopeptide repeat protein [Tenacibaculum adriaticum]